jgi:PASTA domain
MRPSKSSVPSLRWRIVMLDRFATCAAAVLLGAAAAAFLVACGAPAHDGEVPPHPGDPLTGNTSPSTAIVPHLVGRDAAMIDKLAAAAGVVPMIEYERSAASRPGTVVRVEPPPGSAIPIGTTITVAVAGTPGTLDELIAADRRSFVGLGADPDGTLVVAVAAGADADAALRRIEPALAGRKHRVVRCATSWAELSRLAVKVSRRNDLRRTPGYAIAVDPAACAVRVQGDIPADVAAALRAEYAAAVAVEPGAPGQRLPRT